MLPVVRHDAIVDAVNTASTISTDELVRLLGGHVGREADLHLAQEQHQTSSR